MPRRWGRFRPERFSTADAAVPASSWRRGAAWGSSPRVSMNGCAIAACNFNSIPPPTTIDAGVPTVVSTPAPAAARLIAPHAPMAAAPIGRIRMASLTTATMFFEPHPDDVRGFGILFPSGTGINALGVLHNADVFGGRGVWRSETWIVGDRDQGITLWDDDRLVQTIGADRHRLTGRDATPLSVHITRWPEAIPIYDRAILAIAPALESLPPWLGLAGNYLGRIGVAALLEQSAAAADRVTVGSSSS